ncbi:MAG: DUF3298 domain-containing protein [Proteobacteria bacterium]|nr:DUF3298 domain-containing protein [Pseudomonadota bacterium]
MPPFFRFLAAALALFLPALASAAGLPVTKKVDKLKSRDFDISIAYPLTGNKAIDGTIRAFVARSIADFRGYGADRLPDERAYSLDTTYEIERNDGKIFAVVFSEYLDTGGAHPNSDYKTFNFSVPSGAEVFLPEIVDGSAGIDRVSKLAVAGLIRAIATGPDSLSDADSIRRGAAPLADNFKHFVLLADRLHILFPPYQVAAYAAGPQEVFIPLAKLKDVLRPDWRAPAPSFDCHKAATAIEHAICADFALARLDRQVAETYAIQLFNAYEDSEKTKLRNGQRAFIAARNASCGHAADVTGCLIKAYRNRLTTLTKPAL